MGDRHGIRKDVVDELVGRHRDRTGKSGAEEEKGGLTKQILSVMP